jgi:lysophospholipid acyltransferase (LPLAT)-like uncharacterized protein
LIPKESAWRRISKSDRLFRPLCWVISLYVRFVYRTNRWQVEGSERPLELRREGRAFILAFWHARLLMIPMAWRRLAPINMLISAHRDGQLIAGAVRYFGVASIAGSTSRGGRAALLLMLKRLKAGECVGITPDGPRGPARTASVGIVNLARLAQAPIVPITYATSRRRILKSWDRFHLAMPFGRGVFLWGEPFAVAAQLDACGLERARHLLEARMIAMDEEAERRVGHAPAAPAGDVPGAGAEARIASGGEG